MAVLAEGGCFLYSRSRRSRIHASREKPWFALDSNTVNLMVQELNVLCWVRTIQGRGFQLHYSRVQGLKAQVRQCDEKFACNTMHVPLNLCR